MSAQQILLPLDVETARTAQSDMRALRRAIASGMRAVEAERKLIARGYDLDMPVKVPAPPARKPRQLPLMAAIAGGTRPTRHVVDLSEPTKEHCA